MDQCSRHDIPPAVGGDLTTSRGTFLSLEFKTWATSVLTRRQLSSTSLTHFRSEVVDPH